MLSQNMLNTLAYYQQQASNSGDVYVEVIIHAILEMNSNIISDRRQNLEAKLEALQRIKSTFSEEEDNA